MMDSLFLSVVANIILLGAFAGALLAWRHARHMAARATLLRIALEEQLLDQIRQTRAELDRTRRARTTFLAATNHDLRQPLQAIACFSAILAARLRGSMRDVVGNLQTSLQVLNNHVEILADLSRLEAGILEPRVVPCPLATVINEVAAGFRTAAADKGLRFTALPCRDMVRTDPLLLRRVLDNLVGNAVRFTQRGGIVLGCRRRGDALRIEVWDSGIGIPGEQLDRIFDEFYQVGNSQRDHRQGLGLGLTVVDRLIILLPDHRITVSSRPGKGSVFAVEVPLASPRRASLPPPADTRQRHFIDAA